MLSPNWRTFTNRDQLMLIKYLFILLLLFSSSFVSDSSQSHGLQLSRLPCPSATPGACSNSCPLSQWFPSPPAFNLSQHQGLFWWIGSWHHWTKYWSFSFSISAPKEYWGLITFMINWFDLLTVQGTLKRLLQPTVQKLRSQEISTITEDKQIQFCFSIKISFPIIISKL